MSLGDQSYYFPEGFMEQYGGMNIQTSGAWAEEASESPSTMEVFDEQLEMLEKTIHVLGSRLAPVLSNYDTVENRQMAPRPEAASHFRGKLERLADLRAALEDIIGRLDL